MANIGSLEVSLSLNASNFNGTVAQVNRNMKAMGSELQAIRARGSEYENSLTGISQKQNVLSRSFDAASIKLQEQRRRYDELVASGTASSAQIERQANAVNQAQAQYNRLERELAEVTEQLRIQSSQWTQTGQRMQEVGNKTSAVGDGMMNVGKKLSMYVTAPIAAMGVGAFKAASDFESAFAGVRKTVDATESEFQFFSDEIRNMSKEIPAAATEIAKVAEAAGQLGIKNDAIIGFTRTMTDMGVATNMSADEAATALARFANITKMSQQDFDKLGSTVVGLGNNFATTESEIIEMSLRLAGAGAQIGMSEADILGLATALSSVGIQAEMGGSALSRVMVRMQVAATTGLGKTEELSKKTGMSLRELQMLAANNSMDFTDLADSLGMTNKEMKNIVNAGLDLENFAKIAGMTSKQFKEMFEKDAVGAIGSFVNGLGNAEQAGESAINMLQEMGITEILLRDSLLRAGNANELFAESIDVANQAWEENVALTNEAEQRYKTTESQLIILKNKITDIGITLGSILIPMVLKVVEMIEPWIEKFANLSEGTQKVILVLGGIAAAIGPVILVIGALVSSIGSIVSAFGAVALVIGEAGGLAAFLATKFAFLGTIFSALTGPIGLTVMALVTGAILIYKNWEPISEFFGVLSEKMVSGFNNVLSTVTAFGSKMSEVPSMMMSVWSGALSKVTGLLDNLKEKLSIVTDVLNVSNAMDGLKIALEAIVSTVLMLLGPWGMLANIILKLFNHTTLLQDVFSMLKGEMSLDEVANNFSKSITGIVENISNLISRFVDMLPSIIDAVVMIVPRIILLAADIVTKLANSITKNLPLVVKAITGLIETLTTTIATLIPQLVEVGVSILTNLINGIVTALPMIIKVVTQLIETVVSTLTKVLPLLLKTGLTIVETLLNGIVTALPLIIESALNIILSLVEGITTALPQIITIGLTVITTLLESIISALPTIIDAAITILITLVGALILLLPKIIEAGIQIIVALVDGLIKAIPAIIEAALTLIVSLVEALILLLPQLIDAGIKIVEALVEGLIQVIPQLIEAAITLVAALVKAIIDLLPELLSAGAQLIVALIEGILSILGQLLKAGGTLIYELLGTILSFVGDLLSAGATLIGKLITGILSLLEDIVSAGAKLITSLIENILSFTKDLLSAGKNLVKSLIDGVVNKTTDMIGVGKDLVSGLISGINQMGKDAIEAITGVVDGVIKKAKDLLGIKSPSRVFKQIGLWTGEGMAIGLNESSPKVNQAMSNIGDGILAVSKNYQKEYTNLIDEFNRKNEDKNDKTLEKIYKIRNNAAKKKRALTQKELQDIALLEASYRDNKLKADQDFNKKYKALVEKSEKEYLEVIKNYIADKKSLDEMSLIEEAAIWEQSIELFAEGSKERISAQKEYQKSVDAINKELVAINKDYQGQMQKINDDLIKQENDLTKAYQDEFNKRQSSLMSFAGLFDEFKVEVKNSGTELLSNLQSQVDGFKQWQDEFAKLASRNIDADLLAELSDLGVKALPELMALNQLTDEQLTQYSALYQEKAALAREQTEAELAGMKEDTDKQILALREAAVKQLNILKAEWGYKIKELTSTTATELSSLQQIGADAGQGLLNGLASMEGPLISKARQIANSISSTIQQALDIHSPSRVMRGFGVNIGQGLVLGMDDMVNKVADASRRLASSVEDNAPLSSGNRGSIDNSKHFKPSVVIHTNDSGAREMERTLRRMQFAF
ncbi:phage tail tape measure protein [Lysinibacillus fusiformis]|uniref:phage tail tape measure protein n=1 Tax=Lysinibacillus fusiformis TaxID=28031 RepID=UPI00087EBE9E|nr:phage tail tape measure protein [Lysinibacillus fusiformis]SCX38542.1 phage tail tape measure protein, TP901 family, core region [Lysinibacillus fusiformis]SDB05698.1 phage tail tape measure protein, TP901 family, core region [Lysinibacillus fusiformis]SFH75725.1 phage tail tape measure protein, TP901 family, core region [Lysinibacillus fusiformis]SFT29827.1 phage tail tape measure protein, TP901 family, core region [Lysinibacillus fusiformis]